MKIGLLSTKNNQLLPYFIKELEKKKFIKIFLILCFQSKKSIILDKNLMKERTGNFFKTLQLKEIKNKIYIEYFQSHNSKVCIEYIKKNRLDFLFNAGVTSKLKEPILKVTKGVINIHPGVLPMYRGCNCVEWAIYNNDHVGNSAHFMTKKYDDGPIIRIEKYDLFKKYDYKKVRTEIYLKGIKLLSKVIKFLRKKPKFKKFLKKQDKNFAQYYKLMDIRKLKYIKKKLKDGNYIYEKKFK